MPTVLLDLPDELLASIVRCFRAGNNYGSEPDWAAAQRFMQLCKRLQAATRNEPWTGWELISEGTVRLEQHKDHPNIVSRIRDLRIPAVHNTSKHSGVKTRDYDTALATAIRRFDRLSSIEIIFHDWDHNWETTGLVGVEERLNLDRGLPYCFQALEAICAFSSTLTSLTLEGIRSPEDQGLVLSILQRNRQIKKLELAYRMDWAVVVALRDEVNCVHSRNLWRLLGLFELLEVLRITCLPARDLSHDIAWSPDIFLPSLRRLDLCRVPLSLGLLQAILARSGECLSLALDEQIIPLLSDIEQPPFPRLRCLTLAGVEADVCLRALECFKKANLVKLDVSIPTEINTFLGSYLHHENRSRSLEVLSAILGPHSTAMDIADIELRFQDKYREAGIELQLRRIDLDHVA